MILEAAKVTLRQSKRFRTVAHANDCIQDVLEGLSELHKNGVVHLDIKPENIFLIIGDRPSSIPVRDSACALRIPIAPEHVATRVRQVWKLGDFDAHRMQDEVVGEYTPEYASPEVAKAKGLGVEILAHPTMDIFSFGLVALDALPRWPHGLLARCLGLRSSRSFLATGAAAPPRDCGRGTAT